MHPYLIQFGVQTAFLFAGLWIMILLQKLDYNFLLLLGAAAITSGIEMVLDHFLPAFISTPVVVGVLIFCIMKITRADQVDVMFTVGVGYALMFCMNLFLLGTLLGDLRPSALQFLDDEGEPPAPAVEVAPVKERQPIEITRLAQRSEDKASAQPRPPQKPGADAARTFSVKAVIKNSDNSSVIIDTGVKSYTLFLGDTTSMKTAKGMATVRFEELAESRVILNVDGEQVRLSYR